MKKYIDEIRDNKLLGNLATRIFQEKPKRKDDFELQVESLFYLGEKYVKEKGRKSFDTGALTSLLWNYDHTVDKKFYKKDENKYREFLEGVFERAEAPYIFAGEVILVIKHEKKEIPVERTRLVGFQVKYFSEHVRELGLTKEAAWMFWGIRDEYTEPVPGKPGYITEHWKFEEPIIPVVKEIVARYDPYEFLKYSIQYDMRERELVFIYKELLAIFQEPEELRELIAENTLVNQEVKADYLAFFDACKALDFKNWATYEFKTALKPDRNDED